MNELALFAGAGGGILGGKLLGWRTVCAVEFNAYAASVLLQRQNDGCLPPFPIWDDVRTFDGRPWRGIVDVISGGFPCQDISCAGKGAGITGERSGLWAEFARIIREVGPRYVFVENSPLLTTRGLDTVLGDLASMGFDAEWGVLGAVDIGAPHKRDRIWIVAHAAGDDCHQWRSEPEGQQRTAWTADGGDDISNAECPQRWQEYRSCKGLEGKDGIPQRQESTGQPGGFCKNVSNTNKERPQGQWTDNGAFGWQDERRPFGLCDGTQPGWDVDWWETEPDVGRVAHGVAARVDRLTAIGNGQVPQCAALAFSILSERLNR